MYSSANLLQNTSNELSNWTIELCSYKFKLKVCGWSVQKGVCYCGPPSGVRSSNPKRRHPQYVFACNHMRQPLNIGMTHSFLRFVSIFVRMCSWLSARWNDQGGGSSNFRFLHDAIPITPQLLRPSGRIPSQSI